LSSSGSPAIVGVGWEGGRLLADEIFAHDEARRTDSHSLLFSPVVLWLQS